MQWLSIIWGSTRPIAHQKQWLAYCDVGNTITADANHWKREWFSFRSATNLYESKYYDQCQTTEIFKLWTPIIIMNFVPSRISRTDMYLCPWISIPSNIKALQSALFSSIGQIYLMKKPVTMKTLLILLGFIGSAFAVRTFAMFLFCTFPIIFQFRFSVIHRGI